MTDEGMRIATEFIEVCIREFSEAVARGDLSLAEKWVGFALAAVERMGRPLQEQDA